MNIEKNIKEELLEAAENTKGAEAFVLLIGYEDEHSMSSIVGGDVSVLSLLTSVMNHALSCHPDELKTKLRAKIAQIILGGDDHAAN